MGYTKGQSGNPNGRPVGSKSNFSSFILQNRIETMYNFFKSFESENDFYVYAHFNPITNECFYVGKGSGKRAWQKQEKTRNPNWFNYIKIIPTYEVRLIVTGLNEEEAFNIENILIKSRQPICNIIE
jgi:hypothetical protein